MDLRWVLSSVGSIKAGPCYRGLFSWSHPLDNLTTLAICVELHTLNHPSHSDHHTLPLVPIMVFLSRHLIVVVVSLLSALALAAPLSRVKIVRGLVTRTIAADYGLEQHARSVSDLSRRSSNTPGGSPSGNAIQNRVNQMRETQNILCNQVKPDSNAISRMLDLFREMCFDGKDTVTSIRDAGNMLLQQWIPAYEEAIGELQRTVPSGSQAIADTHRKYADEAKRVITSVLSSMQNLDGGTTGAQRIIRFPDPPPQA